MTINDQVKPLHNTCTCKFMCPCWQICLWHIVSAKYYVYLNIGNINLLHTKYIALMLLLVTFVLPYHDIRLKMDPGSLKMDL